MRGQENGGNLPPQSRRRWDGHVYKYDDSHRDAKREGLREDRSSG